MRYYEVRKDYEEDYPPWVLKRYTKRVASESVAYFLHEHEAKLVASILNKHFRRKEAK